MGILEELDHFENSEERFRVQQLRALTALTKIPPPPPRSVSVPMQGSLQLLVPPAPPASGNASSHLDSLDTTYIWNTFIQLYSYTKTNLKKDFCRQQCCFETRMPTKPLTAHLQLTVSLKLIVSRELTSIVFFLLTFMPLPPPCFSVFL